MPFLVLLVWLLLGVTLMSKPRNLALSVDLVMSVFSSDSSRCSSCAMKLPISSLTLAASALLPMIPIMKSSAYLTYCSLRKLVSIGFLHGSSLCCLSSSFHSWIYFCLSSSVSASFCFFINLRFCPHIRLYSLSHSRFFPRSNSPFSFFIYLSNWSRYIFASMGLSIPPCGVPL